MFERAKSAVRTPKPQTGEPLPHESAKLHVTGEALYTDDIATPADTLTHMLACPKLHTPESRI